MTARVVVITGATGFVGGALCRRFAAAGWQVRAGVRDLANAHFGDPAIRPFRCHLPDALDAAAFRGAEAVIHAAYATQSCSPAEARAVNVRGTARVLRASRRAGARFVFVSSCSAHAGAQSLYGRSKYALERRLDPTRDLIVRPGLVLGGGGLAARMAQTLRRSPVVPLFDGGRQPLQTVHIDDLTEALLRLVSAHATGLVVLAEAEPVALRDFMRLLAAQVGARPVWVPMPSAPVLVALGLAERLGLRLPIGRENLLGLRGLVRQEAEVGSRLTGLRIRPAAESLQAGYTGCT
jgi:NADH dehydrogenase